MRHDWIFDVLSDLKAYAAVNHLPALAAKAEEALVVARAEIAAVGAGDGKDDGDVGGEEPARGDP